MLQRKWWVTHAHMCYWAKTWLFWFQHPLCGFPFLQDSKFLRVHHVLPVSTFRMMDSENLVLSQPFLQFLHALPLDYNYALYREIFQRFGTHYYHSGILGGRYDLLYQYSREELKSSGAKWTMTMKIIDDLRIEIQTVNLKICRKAFAEDLSSGSLMSKKYVGVRGN